MTQVIAILIGLVIVSASVMYAVWRRTRKRGLSPALRAQMEREWKNVLNQQDVHRRIMDAEKVVDHALTALGYSGTFADKLKVASPRFSDVQPLWSAHKLRNRIAHEVGITVSAGEAARAVAAFGKALHELR